MAKPKVRDNVVVSSGDAAIDAALATLQAAGYAIKKKKEPETVIPELLAELKVLVEKYGGADKVKRTFIDARKQLFPPDAKQQKYAKARAEKRKADKEAAKPISEAALAG